MKKILVLIIFINLVVDAALSTNYYVSPSGNDNNDGASPETAWKTLDKINNTNFGGGGNTIHLKGGEIFEGNIEFTWKDWASTSKPNILTSYGSGKATIKTTDPSKMGIRNVNAAGWKIKNLIIEGTGNASTGIWFFNSEGNNVKKVYVLIEGVEVSDFKTGISVSAWDSNGSHNGWENVTLNNNVIHDCYEAGIRSYGRQPIPSKGTFSNSDFTVSNNHIYNIIGDPDDADSHTGHGIWISHGKNSTIENNLVHDGGNNNRTCGGPVGIWFNHVDNFLIQKNEVYNWKMGTGCDGAGFDLDGSCTNCTVQYNYSHDNEGPGYLGGNFSGTGLPWGGNIIRYNISINDASKYANGITFFNANGETFNGVEVYNNTIIITNPDGGHAFGSKNETWLENIKVYNNIFYCANGSKTLQIGQGAGNEVYSNLYYNPSGNYSFVTGQSTYYSLTDWQNATGHEKIDNQNVALYDVDPLLTDPTNSVTIGVIGEANAITVCDPTNGSPVIDAGLDLNEKFGIETGTLDFALKNNIMNGKPDLGAVEYQASTGLNCENNSTVFQLCPNPVVNTLTINGDVPINTYSVFNLNGVVMLKGNGNKIDFLSLAKGVYLLVINNTQKIKIIRK